MKTLKQIADEIGISKQRVYRFVKSEGIEPHQSDCIAAHYDDMSENRIKAHFTASTPHQPNQNHISEAAFNAVLDTMKTELEVKNQQIADLTNALAASQALHAGTMKHLSDSEKPEGGFFSRVFSKKKSQGKEN